MTESDITTADLTNGFNELNIKAKEKYRKSTEELLTDQDLTPFEKSNLLAQLLESDITLNTKSTLIAFGGSEEQTNGHSKNSPLMHVAHSICRATGNDSKLKEEIEARASAIKNNGMAIGGQTLVAGSLLTTMANYLITSIPGLSTVGPIVIAGILLWIISIGLDALCSWVGENWHEK